jgi:hypothetical protein
MSDVHLLKVSFRSSHAQPVLGELSVSTFEEYRRSVNDIKAIKKSEPQLRQTEGVEDLIFTFG